MNMIIVINIFIIIVSLKFETAVSFVVQYDDGKLIQVEHQADSVHITCTLTAKKIATLGFKVKENQYISHLLEMSLCTDDYMCVHDAVLKTTVTNATSIKAILTNEEISNAQCFTKISCWVNHREKRLDSISLIENNGTKPEAVNDLDCKFFEFQEVVCYWTGPQNCAYTQYSLSFSPRNYYRSQKWITLYDDQVLRNQWIYERHCNSSTRNMEEEFDPNTGIRKYICVWKLDYPDKVNNFYYAGYYDFQLQMNNIFGYSSQNVTYAHSQHVISGAPVVETYETTPHSIRLLLGSRDPSKGRIPCSNYAGFDYLLSYKSEYDYFWNNTNISACIRHGKFYLKPDKEIENLRYANARYTIKVVSKNVFYAGTGDGVSQPTFITAKTDPEVPSKPPDTVTGGFEFVSKTSVRIFWKQINKTEENGNQFYYYIEADESVTANVSSLEFSKTFFNLKNQNYTFRIWSANEVGMSANCSIVFVPRYKQRLEPLEKITQIYDNTNNNYLFVWESPSDVTESVNNYTIFWCKVRDHLLDPSCEKNWHWKSLPTNSTNLTSIVEEHENYQFGISVNTNFSSSGISRTKLPCILNRSGFKDNIGIIPEEKHAQSITLSWKPNCTGLIYTLYYCPEVSPNTSYCSNRAIQKSIVSHKSNYTMKKLFPNTSYVVKLEISSPLFMGDKMMTIYTTSGSNRYAFIILIFVASLMITLGFAAFMYIKKIRNHMKEIQIEPVFPSVLSHIIADTTSAKLNLHHERNADYTTSSINNESKIITKNQNGVSPKFIERKFDGAARFDNTINRNMRGYVTAAPLNGALPKSEDFKEINIVKRSNEISENFELGRLPIGGYVALLDTNFNENLIARGPSEETYSVIVSNRDRNELVTKVHPARNDYIAVENMKTISKDRNGNSSSHVGDNKLLSNKDTLFDSNYMGLEALSNDSSSHENERMNLRKENRCRHVPYCIVSSPKYRFFRDKSGSYTIKNRPGFKSNNKRATSAYQKIISDYRSNQNVSSMDKTERYVCYNDIVQIKFKKSSRSIVSPSSKNIVLSNPNYISVKNSGKSIEDCQSISFSGSKLNKNISPKNRAYICPNNMWETSYKDRVLEVIANTTDSPPFSDKTKHENVMVDTKMCRINTENDKLQIITAPNSTSPKGYVTYGDISRSDCSATKINRESILQRNEKYNKANPKYEDEL